VDDLYTPRRAARAIRVDYAPAPAQRWATTHRWADQPASSASNGIVPGLNSWLIIGLLSVVWGILFFVAVAVIRIARAGEVVPVQRRIPATAMASSRALDGGGAGPGR
jgi:hypothetical protein